MKYLLDTHTFIWLDSTPANLSQAVSTICKNPLNVLLISIASVWEMQIKISANKLSLPRPLPEIIQWQVQNNFIQILPINLSHVFALDGLPHNHRDPFDRILIAQAQIEDLTILSRDPEFRKYAVQVIW